MEPDEGLYGLEERVYGDFADAVRAAAAPQDLERSWMDRAMEQLVRVQDNPGIDELEAARAAIAALEREVGSYPAGESRG